MKVCRFENWDEKVEVKGRREMEMEKTNWI